jgi:hypothetical protein
VSDNPLHNLTVLQRPDGVMTRGRWYTRQDLDSLLEQLARN